MAGRIRTIKPEVLSDAKAARLGDRAWRLWVSMWTLADDTGLAPADVDYLSAQVFWGTKDKSAHEARVELVNAGFISLYEINGEVYAKINGWKRHQKIDKPSGARFPLPPEGLDEIRESSRILANVREDSARDHDQRPPITTTTAIFPTGEPATAGLPKQSAFGLATQEPPRPKGKATAPEVAEAITYFQRRWVDLRRPTDGKRPTLTDADRGQLTRLLGTHGLEPVKGFIERFLDDEDSFLAKEGYALKHLPSRLDGYRTKAAEPRKGNTAPSTFTKGGDLTDEYT